MLRRLAQRVDTVAELLYSARTSFAFVNHDCSSMMPRVPSRTRLTVRKNVDTYHVGDLVAVRCPGNSEHVLVRSVVAAPGHTMVSRDPEEQSFALGGSQYWVKAVRENHADSSEFGPVETGDIVGRVVYCSTIKAPINNSVAAFRQDWAKEWMFPLLPHSFSDLKSLWQKTSDKPFLQNLLASKRKAGESNSSDQFNVA